MSRVSANDVAAYILDQLGPTTAMKLQKLVYYAQAWSLVWDDAPLFDERIEAWKNGPVVRELYEQHKGLFAVTRDVFREGDPSKLNPMQRETVDAVLSFYGDKGAQWLSDLTHREDPWRQARTGIADGIASDAEITHASMVDYYSNLDVDE